MSGLLLFVLLSLAGYAAAFAVAMVTSVVLTKVFVEPGYGRVIVNAELFRYIWSWGVTDRAPLQVLWILFALAAAGLCVALVTSVGLAFLLACVGTGVAAAIAVVVLFFTI